ncbi:tRNA (guanosine(46)-N7)-methyltransferase TrmB [Guptibacillus hwajinpoensis]|uniref:tRNA (guanine-N(7)-)-methyltransferase n=1 Tax=Guptibacillus hwajinpoensis TaxID=208199 RepID=A0A0J6CW10_9BACL|nr:MULTISPECIES: tRNA (guanosine(46)-N7)-methyltransferase TrmB [Bacillaceae]KMM37343.1 tRNA (guanine-N7)-methyltransferase [Alkalihalobacillus macyae]TKD67983.1 tRNA (guanosine(46)-N7)-methyltransferase TrmB [Pseudalkalibacillus hwajinpoensis]
MRQRNKPWAEDMFAENPELVPTNPSERKGKWNDVFNNSNPIHLEVGIGKGQFIIGMAKQNPDVNFVGLELSSSVMVSALEKLLEEDVPNVRLLNENAQDLTTIFEENEVSRIYLNFSDPWPKNRHEKRRLTYKTFLDLYRVVMKPNSEVHFKTDNQGLFEYSLHSFSAYGMTLNEVSLDLHRSEMENNVMTEYEEKFSAKGSRIYRCEAQFRS